jgi:uncharacterized membrane protein YdjX (TVP38/TMEM64 family)
MKNVIKYTVVFMVWAIAIYFLYSKNLLTLDIIKIKQFFSANQQYAILLFLLLSVIRIFAFIPGAPFMILGGICFGPAYGILLSIIGIIISETLIYLIAISFSNSKLEAFFNRKYPDLRRFIDKYSCVSLVLGIICPLAPSDTICFLSASAGIDYVKYISTVAIANLPAIILYSLLGLNFSGSIYSLTLIALSTALIGFISIRIWNNLKNTVKVN